MIWMMKTLMMMNNAALITAAGSSQRFGEKKEYIPFSVAGVNATVLSTSLYAFVSAKLFSHYVITAPQGELQTAAALLKADKRLRTLFAAQQEKIIIVEGGGSRQESVYKGLLQLQNTKTIYVLVHDGARPWVSAEVIAAVMSATEKYEAAVPSIPVTDTQKEIDNTGKIIRHLRRDRLTAVQTPQGFLFKKLLYAHRCAEHDGNVYTDDSEIYAKYCGPVYTCRGSRENKKITYREDIEEAP